MTDGLRSLEKLRTDAVDQAKVQLAQQQKALAQAELRVRDSAARLAHVSAQLYTHSLADLSTAADLAWAERSQRAARLQQAQCEARLKVAQCQRAQAQGRVEQAEQQMLDSELGRRAVGHVLTQREASRAYKSELRAEEEAADAHRARPR